MRKSALIWEKGYNQISAYQQTKHTTRMFCASCGSVVASTHNLTPDLIYLSLGGLENGESIQIEYQQFTASKAPWTVISEDIPAYEDWPDWIKRVYKPEPS